MRVPDSILDTVVFLGHATDVPGKGGIECVGTGFLLNYDDVPHLVTVRHIAEHFENGPFLIRANLYDRKSADNIHIDQVKWHFSSDPEIDVAVIPFGISLENGYSARYIDDQRDTWWTNKARKFGAGIGDFVYTVGLFRLLAGAGRNMPVVHFGTIARTIDWIEKVPIRDWRDRSKSIQTDAYLVETQNLSGLSGSPVFIRASNCHVDPDIVAANPHIDGKEELGDAVAMWKLHLLGMWQGSWDAAPDHVLGLEHGREVRVPVGMGVVVPADHIHSALENPELKEIRQELKRTRPSLIRGALI
jgi:hypothetical protein